MELIDRTALLEKSYYRGKPATVNHPWGDGAEVVDVEDIEAMPIIDAVPVVHGRWETVLGVLTPGGDPLLRCPICRSRESEHLCGIEYRIIWHYCPICGAKMDLEE